MSRSRPWTPPLSEAYQLVHQPSQQMVAQVSRADGWWTRGLGLMGRRGLPARTGLWLPGVASVHTCFVRFPLDLLFLDREMRAVRLASHVRPWRLLVSASGAYHTIELSAGTLVGRRGDLWEMRQDSPGLLP